MSEKGKGQFNGTMSCKKKAIRKQRDHLTTIRNRVIPNTEYGSHVESSYSKKSWVDEFEDEANVLGKKKSIWDVFDIEKLANADTNRSM